VNPTAATGDSFFYSFWVKIRLFKCAIDGVGLSSSKVETIQSIAQLVKIRKVGWWRIGKCNCID